jgi:rubredoxin
MVKIDQADKYFSLFVRTRDNWTCQRCGHQFTPPTNGLHCSHFMGRGKEGTRFEPMNADALCYGCHQYFTSHPAEHLMWQVERKGQKMIDQLIVQSNTYKRKDRKMEVLIWKQALKDIS